MFVSEIMRKANNHLKVIPSWVGQPKDYVGHLLFLLSFSPPTSDHFTIPLYCHPSLRGLEKELSARQVNFVSFYWILAKEGY